MAAMQPWGGLAAGPRHKRTSIRMPPGEGHSTQLDPAQRLLVPNLHELTRLCLTLRTGLRLEDALFAKFIHLSFLELVALALMKVVVSGLPRCTVQ